MLWFPSRPVARATVGREGKDRWTRKLSWTDARASTVQEKQLPVHPVPLLWLSRARDQGQRSAVETIFWANPLREILEAQKKVRRCSSWQSQADNLSFTVPPVTKAKKNSTVLGASNRLEPVAPSHRAIFWNPLDLSLAPHRKELAPETIGPK